MYAVNIQEMGIDNEVGGLNEYYKGTELTALVDSGTTALTLPDVVYVAFIELLKDLKVFDTKTMIYECVLANLLPNFEVVIDGE